MLCLPTKQNSRSPSKNHCLTSGYSRRRLHSGSFPWREVGERSTRPLSEHCCYLSAEILSWLPISWQPNLSVVFRSGCFNIAPGKPTNCDYKTSQSKEENEQTHGSGQASDPQTPHFQAFADMRKLWTLSPKLPEPKPSLNPSRKP